MSMLSPSPGRPDHAARTLVARAGPSTDVIGLLWSVLSDRSATTNAILLVVTVAVAVVGIVLALGYAGVGGAFAGLAVALMGGSAIARHRHRARPPIG